MRGALAVLVFIAGCGSSEPRAPEIQPEPEAAAPRAETEAEAVPEAPPPPEPPPPPAFAISQPSLSTDHGPCTASEPIEAVRVARGRLGPSRVAVGPDGPLIAWLSESVVHAMPVDADGRPRGPEHDVGLPVSSDMNARYWRDAGFWLAPTPGGFVIATHVEVSRRDWALHFRALDTEGAPLGAPVQVETNRAPEEHFQVIPAAAAVYVRYPDGARVDRLTIAGGALAREALGASEGAEASFLAVSRDGQRHATLVRRRRDFVLRRADGAETPLDGFPAYDRILEAGFDGDRVVFVYETREGERRPSWAVTVAADGTVATPLSIRRDTPLPAPFEDHVGAVLAMRYPEWAQSPADFSSRSSSATRRDGASRIRSRGRPTEWPSRAITGSASAAGSASSRRSPSGVGEPCARSSARPLSSPFSPAAPAPTKGPSTTCASASTSPRARASRGRRPSRRCSTGDGSRRRATASWSSSSSTGASPSRAASRTPRRAAGPRSSTASGAPRRSRRATASATARATCGAPLGTRAGTSSRARSTRRARSARACASSGEAIARARSGSRSLASSLLLARPRSPADPPHPGRRLRRRRSGRRARLHRAPRRRGLDRRRRRGRRYGLFGLGILGGWAARFRQVNADD